MTMLIFFSSLFIPQVMKEHGVYNMVFSSSCVVYGNPQYLPIDEAHPAGNVTNVYGRTKYAVEQMLMDICRAEKVSDSLQSELFMGTSIYFIVSRKWHAHKRKDGEPLCIKWLHVRVHLHIAHLFSKWHNSKNEVFEKQLRNKNILLI